VVRIITSSFIVALSLAVAAPALSASLDPHERDAMLSACGNLSGGDRSLCVEVVNDDSIVANTKRSCLQAMRHMVRGSAWDTVRGTPYAMTCRDGLRRAVYPVNSVMRRLAGAQ
jgi:hypothetical protein